MRGRGTAATHLDRLLSNNWQAIDIVEKSNPDWWVPMGRIILRGRAQPVDIYQPKPDFPAEDARKLEEAAQLTDSKPDVAARLVDEVVAGHPDDLALRNYGNRIRNLNDGGAYVLG